MADQRAIAWAWCMLSWGMVGNPHELTGVSDAGSQISTVSKCRSRSKPARPCRIDGSGSTAGSDAMNIQSNSRYHEVHARSLRDPEGFWAEAAREIDWIEPARKIFDSTMGPYGRWFTGAVVNTCYNALDRHVAGGRGDQVALIHDSPLTNTVSTFTYSELLTEVQTLA